MQRLYLNDVCVLTVKAFAMVSAKPAPTDLPLLASNASTVLSVLSIPL
ncbi:hypothetical protein [Coleofasciculus chthonoplastes]